MISLEIARLEGARFDLRLAPGLRDRPVDELQMRWRQIRMRRAIKARIEQQRRADQTPSQSRVDLSKFAISRTHTAIIFAQAHRFQQRAALTSKRNVFVGQLATFYHAPPFLGGLPGRFAGPLPRLKRYQRTRL